MAYAALLLLQRLKARFPAARASCGHRLFLSAFIIASKLCGDETYSTRSWCLVGQNMFQPKQVNQMERELCGYLAYNLHVTASQIADFQEAIRTDRQKAFSLWGGQPHFV